MIYRCPYCKKSFRYWNALSQHCTRKWLNRTYYKGKNEYHEPLPSLTQGFLLFLLKYYGKIDFKRFHYSMKPLINYSLTKLREKKLVDDNGITGKGLELLDLFINLNLKVLNLNEYDFLFYLIVYNKFNIWFK